MMREMRPVVVDARINARAVGRLLTTMNGRLDDKALTRLPAETPKTEEARDTFTEAERLLKKVAAQTKDGDAALAYLHWQSGFDKRSLTEVAEAHETSVQTLRRAREHLLLKLRASKEFTDLKETR